MKDLLSVACIVVSGILCGLTIFQITGDVMTSFTGGAAVFSGLSGVWYAN